MKTIVAAVLNGALVFATAAGFLALGAGAPAQGTLIAAYAVSVALAAVSAFFSIGGREAWLAHRALDISFCAALAVMWTGALVAFALMLISSLLPADWLSADTAKAWLLAGTAAQAVLLAILARPQARLQGRDLELK
jgi:hypothetical protein